ncbi:TetR/AcrR family transcriptional regulator [Cryptosporangium sp. NPDC048952]|uniref:TetR/AcrR family transcriptional regulator n=1 Tax=Cryptosporangium sp. NPDC048952 TaxID=3363961 RepID=UPI00370FFD25
MPKVSEAHLQARRQQILDAAAVCFARDGFHRTSMQDIVRECGVSAGLVYRYFSGKDEMIAEIVRDWHAHRASALTSSAPGAAYLDLLREIGTSDAPDARLALQVWAESVRSDELRALARDGISQALEATREQAPAGVDPEALIRVLIAVYQGLLVQTAWDSELDNAAFVDVVEEVLRRLTAE